MGACVIEKHFCITRDRKNPDSEFSIEYQDFKELVKQVRIAEKLIGRPYYEGVDNGGHRFRSLYVTKDIKAGEEFTADNIKSLRPGYGIQPKYYDEILGRHAARDIEFGDALNWDMIKEK